jgi:hypothetical protein
MSWQVDKGAACVDDGVSRRQVGDNCVDKMILSTPGKSNAVPGSSCVGAARSGSPGVPRVGSLGSRYGIALL